MKPTISFIFILSVVFTPLSAAKRTTASIVAKEPVTMMDLGLLKLNSMLSNNKFRGLHNATIGSIYNYRRGTIDIKVSNPVKKASRSECKKAIHNTKSIFVQSYGKEKVANIHHYFKHEGKPYKNKIKWKKLAYDVVVTVIVLTKSNYQHSVYCQSNLMKKKITF